MTDHPESLHDSIEDHDVTRALTPGQLIVLLAGLWTLLRMIRGPRR